jgi:hypothetical protein
MSTGMSTGTSTGTSTVPLTDLARVVRSKNAGPFELTFDVMFDDPDAYRLVRHAGVLTRAAVSRMYQVPDEEIVYCDFFEPALAFKATIVRHGNQGGVGERDTFGAQQHAPFLELRVPVAGGGS